MKSEQHTRSTDGCCNLDVAGTGNKLPLGLDAELLALSLEFQVGDPASREHVRNARMASKLPGVTGRTVFL